MITFVCIPNFSSNTTCKRLFNFNGVNNFKKSFYIPNYFFGCYMRTEFLENLNYIET